MNKTIDQAWQSYRDEVLPPNAGEVQVRETRRAFYAGAWALLMLQMGPMAHAPTAESLQMITDWYTESLAFRDQVNAGLA